MGDGANRWPAVHRDDAARLFRLALEGAPAGSVLHAVGDEGVPIREIAEAFGEVLAGPDKPFGRLRGPAICRRMLFIRLQTHYFPASCPVIVALFSSKLPLAMLQLRENPATLPRL